MFKLKCPECGEVNNCDETIFDQQLACGSCSTPIVLAYYPKALKAKEERDERLRVERKKQKINKEKAKEQLRREREIKWKEKRQKQIVVKEEQQLTKPIEYFDLATKIEYFDLATKTVIFLIFVFLSLLAFSTLLPWIKIFSGSIIGIRGDGKFLFGITIILSICLAISTYTKKHLFLNIDFCNGWGIITTLWMLGIIFRFTYSDVPSSDSQLANAFAEVLLTQVGPGSGLYLGLLSSVGLVATAWWMILRIKSRSRRTLSISAISTLLGIIIIMGVNNRNEIGAAPTASDQLFNGSVIQKETQEWEILNTDYKVTEQNEIWWQWAWKITIRNNGKPIRVKATIKFVDKEGFIINTKETYEMVPHGEHILTGYTLILLPGAKEIEGAEAIVKEL